MGKLSVYTHSHAIIALSFACILYVYTCTPIYPLQLAIEQHIKCVDLSALVQKSNICQIIIKAFRHLHSVDYILLSFMLYSLMMVAVYLLKHLMLILLATPAFLWSNLLQMIRHTVFVWRAVMAIKAPLQTVIHIAELSKLEKWAGTQGKGFVLYV